MYAAQTMKETASASAQLVLDLFPAALPELSGLCGSGWEFCGECFGKLRMIAAPMCVLRHSICDCGGGGYALPELPGCAAGVRCGAGGAGV